MKNSQRTSTKNSTRSSGRTQTQARGSNRSHPNSAGRHYTSDSRDQEQSSRMLGNQYNQYTWGGRTQDQDEDDTPRRSGGDNRDYGRSQITFGYANEDDNRSSGRGRSSQNQPYDNENNYENDRQSYSGRNPYENEDFENRSNRGRGFSQHSQQNEYSSGRSMGGRHSAESQDRDEYGQFSGNQSSYEGGRGQSRSQFNDEDHDDINDRRRTSTASSGRRGYSQR
ncbi:MAG: hypothetical protein J0L93_09245 [Deltaproteobacteria bacterium]|nr:hypothetical protein [Deltaproteobacteria bacterium]